MPSPNTPRMKPLSSGLALNAVSNVADSAATMTPTVITKNNIRVRKRRGLDISWLFSVRGTGRWGDGRAFGSTFAHDDVNAIGRSALEFLAIGMDFELDAPYPLVDQIGPHGERPRQRQAA